MEKINYSKREDNTQKVYLTENTISITPLLEEEYEYVYTFVKKQTEKNIIIDGKNKAIKEQDKIINPNTEDKIYLCLVILIITILVIINYKHKKIKKYY